MLHWKLVEAILAKPAREIPYQHIKHTLVLLQHSPYIPLACQPYVVEFGFASSFG